MPVGMRHVAINCILIMATATFGEEIVTDSDDGAHIADRVTQTVFVVAIAIDCSVPLTIGPAITIESSVQLTTSAIAIDSSVPLTTRSAIAIVQFR